jgi:hypothetical protein
MRHVSDSLSAGRWYSLGVEQKLPLESTSEDDNSEIQANRCGLLLLLHLSILPEVALLFTTLKGSANVSSDW